jgi:ribosomal protein L11 methyltransferase
MGGVESVIQEVVVRVNPGAGFGTGTHETTQLCLEALGGLALERIADRGKLADAFDGLSVLDFGSGSGILGIACALLGARVEAVEIDPLAIANATENADLNQVRGQVRFSQTLAPSPERFPLVLANILRPVLLEFASELVSRLAPGGALVLSGLMEGDVAEVSARYTALLGGKTPEVFSSGEWRALVFRAPSSLAQ